LDGVRSIKILGAKGQPPSYRANTTEKRFVSATRSAQNNLLPFGWLWIDGSDDAHRHLSIAVSDALATLGRPIREAHAEQLAASESRREAQAEAVAETARRRSEEAATALAEAAALEQRQAALAAMSPERRRIEEFRGFCDTRTAQLAGNKETLNGDIHNRARQLATDALQQPDWRAEDKTALADLIAERLPRLVAKMDKDQLKKLKLAALRGLHL
jgi:CRISPR-associated protein Csm5